MSARPDRPLRVAMLARVIYPLHGFGGTERHVALLVRHLARLGVEVTLYVQHPTTDDRRPTTDDRRLALSEAKSELFANGPSSFVLRPSSLPDVEQVAFLRYDYTSPYLRPNSILGRQINYPWYAWQLGRAAATAARRGVYDIVHAHGLCAAGYGWIRRRDPALAQLPFIANPHGLEEYRTADWRKRLAYAPFRALYSYGNRRADRVIATDACTSADLPRYLGVDPRAVVVLPNAIDVEECLGYVAEAPQAALRARFHLGQAAPLLLSVGRLERNKGYQVLLAALGALRDRLPKGWRWLLVGAGKERGALEAQARALGLADHVTFAGVLDDAELHNLYEQADLFVHPTLYEGSSIVTLEAMIHRRPVVASAAGGIPDKVIAGCNGYLARPGDADDLAAKLALALDAQARWPDWGAESARIVRQMFDWRVVARQTVAVYEEMMEEQAIRSGS